jgi:hypothetical protein
MESKQSISIDLQHIAEGLSLQIHARPPSKLFDASHDQNQNNEATHQIIEGCFYDYEFSNPDYVFVDMGEQIIQPQISKPHLGRIAPNIYVGTFSLPIQYIKTKAQVGNVELEVQSIKTSYREDYRDMLEYITEKCTDLLLQSNAPVLQTFDPDYTRDWKTLYQRFAFIKSVIDTDDFTDAVHRIVTNPVTTWHEIEEERDIRNTRRFSNANIKEILKGGNRTALKSNHPFTKKGIHSLPQRITSIRKSDSVDTPENRFIKHALESFEYFCANIHRIATTHAEKRLKREANQVLMRIHSQLEHTIFDDISRPTTLKLNSPVLQRKEGYREVLRVWLIFDLAAKLIWQGGEDIYKGGKKDIAVLYEYWLFFKLLDLLQQIFQINPVDIENLIKPTEDGLNLTIKQGRHTALKGVYTTGARKLQVKFSYNRSFSGRKPYPSPGSWTVAMRPDYTLSIWPLGISEQEAEKEELIVHIHFDAKYKISNLRDIIQSEGSENLDQEDPENRKGKYKNADLLKMHAYKDAIRRTGGAYILYPGTESSIEKGFHEIIPGLGAFPVRPSKTDDGTADLRQFIEQVLEHFLNRTSQREKMAFRKYDIHKEKPDPDSQITDALPESYGSNRDFMPDETYVVVGYVKSEEHRNWITKNGLYNLRLGTGRGSIPLTKEYTSARYILLHGKGDKYASELWKIVGDGPRVVSKGDLERKGYPEAGQEYYLVYEVERVIDPEFEGVSWNFKELNGYANYRLNSKPFITTLIKLMKSSHP